MTIEVRTTNVKGFLIIEFLYSITRINKKVKNKRVYSFILKQFKHLSIRLFTFFLNKLN